MHVGVPADDERVSATSLAARPDFRLGAAEISPSTRKVKGPGGETSLDPRAMQVLMVLAADAGRVVTRDALFRRCWGNAVVGDDSLNHAIADVRRAAKTAAAGAFAVETVPRTGYRLVLADLSTDPVSAHEDPAPASKPLDRRVLLAGTGAGVLALGGGAFAVWRASTSDPTTRRASTLADEARVALRDATPEGDARAVASLQAAAALRPRDPDLWGLLALARLRLSEAEDGTRADLISAVQVEAGRALALDPKQADARSALAQLPPYFGDWSAAEARFRAVLQDTPRHRPTQDAYAFFKMAVGRTDEGATERLAFSTREPLDAGHQYRLGYAWWFLGRIDEADRTLNRALELWPKHLAVWFARVWVLLFTDRSDHARAMAEAARADGMLPPVALDPLIATCRAIASRRPEDVAEAERANLALLALSPSFAVNAWLLLAGMGRNERALDVAEAYLLEQGPLVAAVRPRPAALAVNDQRRRKTHMLFTPVAEDVRRSPRFLALTRRIGLASYWREARVTPTFLDRA